MELFMNILLLLGGVGVFLTGMKHMSNGMKQSAGEGIKRLFNKIGKNRFVGYGVGIGATAIVQSSSATTIMTIGMANARIVNTEQGAPIILGAKVGTTLTAFIFALSGLSKGGFSVGITFGSMAFVGAIMLMVASSDKQKSIATFLLGFGMLFLGLEIMGLVLGSSESTSNMLKSMFNNPIFTNPFLLIIIGLVFTCVIQSSTAATAIFIAFLTTGVLKMDQSFFLVLGANIGTCSDGLMASIGGSADGKRLALYHLYTSTLGAVFFGLLTIIFRKPIVGFFENVIVRPEWCLAIYNLFYNVIYTLILLAIMPSFVKFMIRTVKEKEKKKESALEYLNPQILQNPTMAVTQTKREILKMGERALSNLDISFNALINGDTSKSNEVFEQENTLNDLNKEISDYLIKLSSISRSMSEETEIGSFHHVINDIERIGDHAKNFMVLAGDLVESQDNFTEQSLEELQNMFNMVRESFALGLDIFYKKDKRRLSVMSAYEKDIDAMHKGYSKTHFKNLRDKSGWAEIQIYYDIITELERIGDHAINIAFSIENPTGDEVISKDTKSKRKVKA